MKMEIIRFGIPSCSNTLQIHALNKEREIFVSDMWEHSGMNVTSFDSLI